MAHRVYRVKLVESLGEGFGHPSAWDNVIGEFAVDLVGAFNPDEEAALKNEVYEKAIAALARKLDYGGSPDYGKSED